MACAHLILRQQKTQKESSNLQYLNQSNWYPHQIRKHHEQVDGEQLWGLPAVVINQCSDTISLTAQGICYVVSTQ